MVFLLYKFLGGINMGRGKKPTMEEINQMIQLYLEGNTINSIADKMHKKK
jgi:hypothetical protein